MAERPKAKLGDLEALVLNERGTIQEIEDKLQATYRAHTTNGQVNADTSPEKLAEALYQDVFNHYWRTRPGQPAQTGGDIWVQKKEYDFRRQMMARFFGEEFSPELILEMLGGPDGQSKINTDEVTELKKHVAKRLAASIDEDKKEGIRDIVKDESGAKDAARAMAERLGLSYDKILADIQVRQGMRPEETGEVVNRFSTLFGAYTAAEALKKYRP